MAFAGMGALDLVLDDPFYLATLKTDALGPCSRRFLERRIDRDKPRPVNSQTRSGNLMGDQYAVCSEGRRLWSDNQKRIVRNQSIRCKDSQLVQHVNLPSEVLGCAHGSKIVECLSSSCEPSTAMVIVISISSVRGARHRF